MFSVWANASSPTQLITKAKIKIDMDAGMVRILHNRGNELHNLQGTVTHLEKLKWDVVTVDGVTWHIDGDGPGCKSCGGTKVRDL